MTVANAAEKLRRTLDESGTTMTVTAAGESHTIEPRPFEQLTFHVGGDLPQPAGASISITGKGDIRRDLFLDDDVTVQIIAAGGEIVAKFDGAVVAVDFKKHRETENTAAWVERTHKIKLGEE